MQLDLSEHLNFGKKVRGKKPNKEGNFKISEKLTRRQVLGKVAEVWDLTGLVTPLVAMFKLDLHELVKRRLDWDDEVPPELRATWDKNFDSMRELGRIKFRQAIVPSDAVSLDVETIEAGDASEEMIIVATYVRIPRITGGYSCQLVFARSKLVPPGMTIPRAELLAARLNAQVGHIVSRSLGDKVVKRYRITDSEISLHWIHSWDKPLKQWVRNCVIDINRFSDLTEWQWVQSGDNPCDLGTRQGVTVEDIKEGSEWFNGKGWMREKPESFPTKTIEDIKLAADEEQTFQREVAGKKQFIPQTQICEFRESKSVNLSRKRMTEEISKRIQFSNYLVDPSRMCFKKLVKVVALVKKFCRILLEKVRSKDNAEDKTEIKDDTVGVHFIGVRNGVEVKLISEFNELQSFDLKPVRNSVKRDEINLIQIDDKDLDNALKYLFLLASKEVRQFCPPRDWRKGVEKEGILFWTGRLLSCQEFSVGIQLSDVMMDLSPTVFCVPYVDNYSPLAWSIMSEVHWNHPTAKHAGVPTVLR